MMKNNYTKRFAYFSVASLALFSLMLMLAAVSSDGQESAEGRHALPEWMLASPGGDRLALMFTESTETARLMIMNDAGEVELDTAARSTEGARELSTAALAMPIAWFPDGERLLVHSFWRKAEHGDEGFSDILVLSVEDGAVESLSRGEGGLTHFTNALVVDESTVILRPSGEAFATDGLYLFQRRDAAWSAENILPDSGGRKWMGCLWAARQGRVLRTVLRAETGPRNQKVTTFWRVEFENGQPLKSERLATFRKRPDAWAASPEGDILAVLRERTMIPFQRRLALISLDEGSGKAANLQCGRNVRELCFSPNGQHLLLWEPGGLTRPLDGWKAELRVMDVATRQIRKLDIPDPWETDSPNWLHEAAWLSEDWLVLGFYNYLVKLSPTGEASETFWHLPP